MVWRRMQTRSLLIIWHSRTGASRELAEAAYEGAGGNSILMAAQDVQPQDILEASGYLFICPENLASMSGCMKEMFDRCYYPVLGRIEGRAYATIIAAGSDGEGAQRQIDRISKGWRLKRIADHVIVNTDAQTSEAILAPKLLECKHLSKAKALGEAFAEGLRHGIF